VICPKSNFEIFFFFFSVLAHIIYLDRYIDITNYITDLLLTVYYVQYCDSSVYDRRLL
jgi:hypothetical protein